MRFACLGSGSEGNGLLVECGGTRVLIDCGFGIRDAVARLARLGVAPESITAIVVTHEHSDHIGGVAAFAARYGTPVWLTFGTLVAVAERFAELPRVFGFDSHDRFAIDDIEVLPFPVPHDARLDDSATGPTGQPAIGGKRRCAATASICRRRSISAVRSASLAWRYWWDSPGNRTS